MNEDQAKYIEVKKKMSAAAEGCEGAHVIMAACEMLGFTAGRVAVAQGKEAAVSMIQNMVEDIWATCEETVSHYENNKTN